MNPIDKFHEHLDNCAQCRDHPFALCKTGAELLSKVAGSRSVILDWWWNGAFFLSRVACGS